MPRLVPTGHGPEVIEIGPRECVNVNGHPLRPPNVQVFSFPCSCSGPAGHRGWRCWTCGEIHYEPPQVRDQGPGSA